MTRPIRVLIAEDNPGDVFLLQQVLDGLVPHPEVVVVNDGGKALEWISRIERDPTAPTPDVILLDLNLPKYDGAEVLERIRASRRLRAARVVIVTSSNSPRDRERVAELGATAYFRKPSDWDEFMKLGQVVQGVL
ncbi:MAG: response regulator [Bryobacterales bacterium]|nr:response regulator [Bryobacterales bacterium]